MDVRKEQAKEICEGHLDLMSWLLLSLVIFSTICRVFGCSPCAPINREIDLCDRTSGFAAVFKIKDNGTVNGVELVYDVDILYKYVFNDPSGSVDRDKLYTSVICGFTLLPDSFSIITGSFREISGKPTKMQSGLCDAQEYFKENPVVNGNPPPCERSEIEWHSSQ